MMNALLHLNYLLAQAEICSAVFPTISVNRIRSIAMAGLHGTCRRCRTGGRGSEVFLVRLILRTTSRLAVELAPSAHRARVRA